ncbi:degV family protein [Cellulomonas fimi ATCC 484]|uniref:DegV family protein n=1 Tax=Cellulomonas fimi (strain ATCC 484 / DSM 20113 / JCM 1341 / CCUG 24087 / LMG 16345 / NBRC 15513 / NCIMB 8980 / NCTC 7547 / NRS-133) TaxID=590998 RepID=F4H3F4_CELFA|nr:degV family protein [Cellulomonas fimi ATCC 484]VEH33234.1 DegV domain-containing protein SAV0749 [Cellulomonas fimi]
MVDGERRSEGVDVGPEELLAALARGARVTTSQPAPAAFAAAYERAVAAGATEIVSVHLAGGLSGTVQAARLAAATVAVPVHVVDSGTAAMGLGFAVLAAARAAALPAAPEGLLARWRDRRQQPVPVTGCEVADVARTTAASAHVWFLVDSLDHLRRGGRLSAPAAALGTVLGLRPILTLRDGSVVVAEKVRTRRAARDRLEAIAVADLARRPAARVAVHHLQQPELAAAVAEQIRTWGAQRVVETVTADAGAVLAAHVGPGLLAVVVADA